MTRRLRSTLSPAISVCSSQQRGGTKTLPRKISRRMRVTSLHAGWLASLPEGLRNELVGGLSPAEARAILYDWPFWARAAQLPPGGTWRIWLLLAGRGFG